MSASSKYLAAVFFNPRTQTGTAEDVEIDELLRRAKATDISSKPDTAYDTSGLSTCTWAGMTCKAEVNEFAQHRLLHIYFLQGSLFKMLGEKREPLPLEEDGALQLALVFRAACEALEPDIAFIATHESQSHPEWAINRVWIIEALDANALGDERLGLLYLNEEISRHWTPNPVRDDRDSLPVSRGRLVFAGRGWGRWF